MVQLQKPARKTQGLRTKNSTGRPALVRKASCTDCRFWLSRTWASRTTCRSLALFSVCMCAQRQSCPGCPWSHCPTAGILEAPQWLGSVSTPSLLQHVFKVLALVTTRFQHAEGVMLCFFIFNNTNQYFVENGYWNFLQNYMESQRQSLVQRQGAVFLLLPGSGNFLALF